MQFRKQVKIFSVKIVHDRFTPCSQKLALADLSTSHVIYVTQNDVCTLRYA